MLQGQSNIRGVERLPRVSTHREGCVMPTQRKIQHYGWVPQLPDLRDAQLKIQAVTSLPSSVDLSTKPDMPPVYDQGQLGSCTGNAIAGAVDYDNHKITGKFLTPARLSIYYRERRHRGHGRRRRRRPDSRWHQVGQPAGSLPRDRLAVRHRDLRQEAAEKGLHRRPQGPGAHVRSGDPGALRTRRACWLRVSRSSSASRSTSPSRARRWPRAESSRCPLRRRRWSAGTPWY